MAWWQWCVCFFPLFPCPISRAVLAYVCAALFDWLSVRAHVASNLPETLESSLSVHRCEDARWTPCLHAKNNKCEIGNSFLRLSGAHSFRLCVRLLLLLRPIRGISFTPCMHLGAQRESARETALAPFTFLCSCSFVVDRAILALAQFRSDHFRFPTWWMWRWWVSLVHIHFARSLFDTYAINSMQNWQCAPPHTHTQRHTNRLKAIKQFRRLSIRILLCTQQQMRGSSSPLRVPQNGNAKAKFISIFDFISLRHTLYYCVCKMCSSNACQRIRFAEINQADRKTHSIRQRLESFFFYLRHK